MTTALLFALALQQAAPAVVWSDDPPPPVEAVVEAAPTPVLPAHALADPYGWDVPVARRLGFAVPLPVTKPKEGAADSGP